MKPEGPATMPWEDQIYREPADYRPSNFHLALETRLSRDEVISRAQKLGWRSLYCERGGVFGVIEVWMDNHYLVEVLTAEDGVRYRQFMNPAGCGQFFGAGVSPETRGSQR